ncbi:stage II sporulation protein M [Natronorubrum sp. JWXQ-INN-674]|uniref:Stage II sporulation protein M n=1 Tax=Natronorubrum halalkaliphilum TaxID=2691917 RepID=A0A6B0VJG0_9EURY|nr:stage II sporulation protein M [Natronorubrum halalkaliphilum]MXV61680.1 stage II sporulation protein M [Natronorubrum halalkaliphilum]
MRLSDTVRAAVAVLRRRPSDLLPWYLLGAAVPAIARVIPFLAIAVGFVYLEVTGRLATIQDHLTGMDTEPPDPNADPDAFEEWASGFDPIVEQLFTLELVALLLLTIGATVLVGVVLSAVVAAGQLTACAARLRDERGLTTGIAGIRRYWLRFLGLYLLEFLLWMAILLTIGMGAALVGGLAVVATGSALVAILVALVAGLFAVAAVAVIRALFAFAPVAVVVDDATAVGSLSNVVAFVRARPIGAAFYYVVAVGTTLAISVVSGVFVLVDVMAFTSLLTVLLVFPALDLLKTALYSGYRGRLAPPAMPDRSLRRQFRDGVGRGWAEMTSFVRATLSTHAVVVALALASFWVGWEVAEPLAGTLETSISARLEGHIPPAAALEFFGNNWMVAITTAFSGIALVLPAIASLLFNGVFMGVYARTEAAPMELLAFVIPHGIFEIPAIFIATAVGIWLGLVGWRTYRGRMSRTAFADALERAFWVLVGVGLLLAVAAFVEGFISPYYFRLFL